MKWKLITESKNLPHWEDVLQNGVENFIPYIELYGEVDDPEELWNGYCNRVANILMEETDLSECGGHILYLSDEELNDGDLITGFHWFITQGGRYYDASSPYGVNSISSLPIVDLIADEHPYDLDEYILKNTMVVDRAKSETLWDSSKTLEILKNKL